MIVAEKDGQDDGHEAAMVREAKAARPKGGDAGLWRKWRALPLVERVAQCVQGDLMGTTGFRHWNGQGPDREELVVFFLELEKTAVSKPTP